MNSNTSGLTCLACMVGFTDPEAHRLHYKSDWHRYNLKRKIMELPPVSAEAFNQKVVAAKAEAEAAAADSSMFCEPCHKRFGNKNAYDNHLASKKHSEAVLKFPEGKGVKARKKSETVPEPTTQADAMEEEEDEDIEEVDSDEWEEGGDGDAIPSEDCLFCSHHSRNIQANLNHMMVSHSFFVPDVEYLTDIVGFLNYLGKKVGVGFRCLWCDSSSKRFRSLDAVQKHMTSLGHCKIRHEGDGLAEYSDFYDYTSSYPDADAEAGGQGEEGAGDRDRGDEEVTLTDLDDSAYELTLPSGAIIGHRSLVRYYKQRFPNRSALENSRKVLKDVMSSYRMKGWTETDRKIAERKARDIRFMNRMRQSQWAKLGIRGNKLQKHFRAQTNF